MSKPLTDTARAILSEKRTDFEAKIAGWSLDRRDKSSELLSERQDVRDTIMRAYDGLIAVFTKRNNGKSMSLSDSRATHEPFVIAAEKSWSEFEKLPGVDDDMAKQLLGSTIKRAREDFQNATGIRMIVEPSLTEQCHAMGGRFI